MDIDGDLKTSGASGKYPAKPKNLRVHAKPETGPKTHPSLGKLHDLLTYGLPEFVNEGVLDVRRLAAALDDGISYQAVYKWFERNRIAPRRATQICQMSRATEPRFRPATRFVNGEEVSWRPLCRDDFWEFMG